MGRVGRWIDGRTDEQKDAIITHPDPTYDGTDWWNHDRGCGCLVGCVMGKESHNPQGGAYWLIPYNWDAEVQEAAAVGHRFVELTRRFGPERVWAAVKARASRGNRITVPEDVPGPSARSGDLITS